MFLFLFFFLQISWVRHRTASGTTRKSQNNKQNTRLTNSVLCLIFADFCCRASRGGGVPCKYIYIYMRYFYYVITLAETETKTTRKSCPTPLTSSTSGPQVSPNAVNFRQIRPGEAAQEAANFVQHPARGGPPNAANFSQIRTGEAAQEAVQHR